jgi:hypothetical protein
MEGNPLWQKAIIEDEFHELTTALMTANKNYGYVATFTLPINTYSTKAFAKSFFCPLVSHGLETDHRTGRTSSFWATAAAVFFDTATLPARAITSIPWIIVSGVTQQSRLLRWLEENHVPGDVWRHTKIKIKLQGPIQTEKLDSHVATFKAVINVRRKARSAFDPIRIRHNPRKAVPPTPGQQDMIDHFKSLSNEDLYPDESCTEISGYIDENKSSSEWRPQ